jgi:hypothetical protein
MLVLLLLIGLFGLGFQELFEASSQQLPACELKLVQLEQLTLLLSKYCRGIEWMCRRGARSSGTVG